MKSKVILILVLAVCLFGFGAGCVKNYRITQNLEQPLDSRATWVMGDIADALPPDTDIDDRPESKHLTLLRSELRNELEKKNLFQERGLPDVSSLEVSGSILEFKRGSGLVRALIGFGLGNAVLTVQLELRDQGTGNVLFSGNFKQKVSSYTESGDECFKRVAKDFAKALDKELSRIVKES